MFDRPGPSLRQGLVSSGESEYNTASVGDYAGSQESSSSLPNGDVRRAACNADIVALGTVTDETAGLSANETSVITLYSFRISTLYKARESLDRTAINVLRHGGTVHIPEGTIRQFDIAIPPFAKGKTYVLFLAKLQEAKAYVSTDPDVSLSAQPDGQGALTSLKGARVSVKLESFAKLQEVLKGLSDCRSRAVSN